MMRTSTHHRHASGRYTRKTAAGKRSTATTFYPLHWEPARKQPCPQPAHNPKFHPSSIHRIAIEDERGNILRHRDHCTTPKIFDYIVMARNGDFLIIAEAGLYPSALHDVDGNPRRCAQRKIAHVTVADVMAAYARMPYAKFKQPTQTVDFVFQTGGIA